MSQDEFDLTYPQLHAEKFEDLIRRRGRYVQWQEAVICPCWNLQSGQSAYSCPICQGIGHTYQEAVVCKVVVTGIAFNKDFNQFAGMFEAGDAVMTVPKRLPQYSDDGMRLCDETTGELLYDSVPMFQVGMHDLITLLDDDWKYSEILVKDTAIAKRQADTLINVNVVEVLYAQHIDIDATTGVQTRIKYTQGVDFVVGGSGNKIVWLPDGASPPTGEKYGVVYTYRPVYTVLTQLPKPRYQDGQAMPKNVVLRLRTGGFDGTGGLHV